MPYLFMFTLQCYSSYHFKNYSKNLTKSFCKVAEDELELQLSKKQKKKSQEGLDMVPMDKNEEAATAVQE